jgi:hypothetical protein
MHFSPAEATELVSRANEILSSHSIEDSEKIKRLAALTHGWCSPEELYVPNDALVSRIEDYRRWWSNQRDEIPGQLMEEIACLAFLCLKGLGSIKSFQSHSKQLDLVVSGNSLNWLMATQILKLPSKQRTIIVEAKNEDNRLADQDFSRLCSILADKFREQAALGVFFTRRGASGFPSRSDDGSKPQRKRKLEYSRATQVLFHARTGKYVVVLDSCDIFRLKQPGALLRILEAKILDVEECSGLPLKYNGPWEMVADLPSHLAQHVQQ